MSLAFTKEYYLHVVLHLHKSMYCDIVPLHNPLTNVAPEIWASIWLFLEASYRTNTDDLSLRKQNMFFVE